MRLSTCFKILGLALVIGTAPLYAHHEEEQFKTGEAFFDSVLILNNTVTDSDVAYSTKRLVYRFVDRAFDFANCVTEAAVDAANSEIDPPHPQPIDRHHHQYEQCASLQKRMEVALDQVQGLLFQTESAIPEVFRAFQAAQGELSELLE